MSFEPIEKYIHELEALKHYDEVKKQRDELAIENAELKDRVSGLEKEVNGLRAELSREVEGRKVAGEELKAEKSSTEKLEAELGKVSKELGALKDFQLKSTGGRNLTLEQARGEFLKDKETEIERRANEKFEVLRANLDAKMPGLVHDKLVETLGKRPWPKEIASTIQEKAKEIADEILKNKKKWPNWFNEFYLEEVRAMVSAGLNAEFNQRVENGATERAEAKLMQLTRIEWPKWYEANIKPKIEENVIRMLRNPWNIWCDKCGTQQEIKLTERNISDLLFIIGYTEKECTNLNCKDYLNIRKHRIRIFLRDLIAAHIRG